MSGETPKDPRLEFDAFTGGIQNGGLRSISTIHLMIGYLIATFQNKVTEQNIIDTMFEGMIANYFQTVDAMEKMKNSGTIIVNEDGTLKIARAEESSIDLIEKDLPLSIREKGIHLCQKLIAKETFRRENKVEINEVENGYNVTMHVSDKDMDFMTLTLYAATITQAEMIREKFISNPINVYNTLIDAIFANED